MVMGIKQFSITCYVVAFEPNPETHATLYDMTETTGGNLARDWHTAVKAVKPDYKTLWYHNLRTCDDNYPDRVALYRENGWLLHDQYGNEITDDVGLLTDIGNSGYQNWVADYLNTQMITWGQDGVFGDWGIINGLGEFAWECSADPINPRTNLPWTTAEVVYALIDLHKAIKNKIGSKLLCNNGIFHGSRFYQHPEVYQYYLANSPMDGIMSEGCWYWVNQTWMTEAQWFQTVQFIQAMDDWLSGHSNRFFVPVCKLAYGSMQHTLYPPGATGEQIAKYAYASTLLATKLGQAPQTYFCAIEDATFNMNMKSTFYDAPIGTPTSEAYIINGTHVYARDFTNGKVLVNPTDTSYTVQQQTIFPHTGLILSELDFAFELPYDGSTAIKLTLGI